MREPAWLAGERRPSRWGLTDTYLISEETIAI
jgi:hypothetical protein